MVKMRIWISIIKFIVLCAKPKVSTSLKKFFEDYEFTYSSPMNKIKFSFICQRETI